MSGINVQFGPKFIVSDPLLADSMFCKKSSLTVGDGGPLTGRTGWVNLNSLGTRKAGLGFTGEGTTSELSS